MDSELGPGWYHQQDLGAYPVGLNEAEEMGGGKEELVREKITVQFAFSLLNMFPLIYTSLILGRFGFVQFLQTLTGLGF